MKKLYSGFDLSAPTTSVSMTINGPAPIILAMFMNTAIDQQVETLPARRRQALGRRAGEDRQSCSKDKKRPTYPGDLPRRPTTASASACSA